MFPGIGVLGMVSVIAVIGMGLNSFYFGPNTKGKLIPVCKHVTGDSILSLLV